MRLTIVLSLLSFSLCLGQKPAKKINLPSVLEEVSGLYYVSPDSLWWHNDSGDNPILYLTNEAGDLLSRIDLPIKHVDWEDITYDEEGWLYIADFGNNRNNRNDLVIYKFHPALQKIDSIPYTYEDQEDTSLSFNAEALVYFQDKLHIFTKDRLPKSKYETRHYTLSKKAGAQVAKFQGTKVLKRRVVTGAAIHTSTGTLGLVAYYYKRFLNIFPCSSASVFFFTDYSNDQFFQGKMQKKKISGIVSTQFESIDFIDDTYYYVASEKTAFIKAKAKRKKWRKVLDH